jgi:hypothetical protein
MKRQGRCGEEEEIEGINKITRNKIGQKKLLVNNSN